MKNCLLVFFLVLSGYTFSQTIISRDPEIGKMIKEVSPDSLRSYVNKMVAFGTRNTLSTQAHQKRGIGAARNWVLQKFNDFAGSANGRLTATIDTTTIQPDGRRVDEPVILGNVIAILKGSDPKDNRIFIISGHLDSRNSDVMDITGDAPGANDDASGVAAVIECARIMSSHSFPATIMFVAFSGEEQGLLGSSYLADRLKKEGRNVVGILNNDIMGSNNSNETNIIDNTKVRVFSEGLPAHEIEKNASRIRALGVENDGKSRQLARYVKEIGERYVDNLEVVMIYRNDRFLRGGDHTPFVQNGYAGIRITEMNENYTHQHQDVRTENGVVYGDLPEYMDFEYLGKNTAMNLASLANLAKAPAVPEEVKIDVSKLTNTSTLSWRPPATGTPKGYYILIRETTSPLWQKKIFTSELELTLPYSKDNYFFGVQAISVAGNESLAVIPVPK